MSDEDERNVRVQFISQDPNVRICDHRDRMGVLGAGEEAWVHPDARVLKEDVQTGFCMWFCAWCSTTWTYHP